MKEQIDVVDSSEAGGLEFEIGKGYVVIARSKGKIIALRAVTHYFHASNITNKLMKDAKYRKEFIEKYDAKK